MMARLTADMWISAYLRRLELAGIPAYVTQRGDGTAGAVLVKLATLDGKAVAYERSYDLERNERAWVILAQGDEREVDAAIGRQKGYDPDLWVIEVEDRKGRHLLDEEGLAG